MDLIDLHAHTTASDGSLTPTALVDLAKSIGLKALAITDHDTLAGLEPALARGREIGLEVVPGVEISAEFKPGAMHILGYDLDFQNIELISKLQQLQESRRTRNPKIVAKLNDLGIPITLEEVLAVTGGGQIGRPHFAKVLAGKGYVTTVQEAFDRYLKKGASAYVDKFRFTPAEAVDLIRSAGGLPVLAHPLSLNLSPEALENLLIDLVKAGMVGLETYYSEHSPEVTRDYIALADRIGLAVTGGSDFHGANKDGIVLGRGLNNLAIPYKVL
ncbi:MAG: PHP domain-containing protein, partial [Deltaproteobacteria bacterium]|nr:PHP domain-containing protein [Deltaproteobacteria bacterium]